MQTNYSLQHISLTVGTHRGHVGGHVGLLRYESLQSIQLLGETLAHTTLHNTAVTEK